MPQIDAFASDSLARLPDAVLSAVGDSEMPGLGEGPVNPQLTQILSAQTDIDWSDLTPHQQALSCSGLWLLAGDLDRSHSISQDIGEAEGSFWHGIMHRREGDFGNSKYWFRRVGSHPVLDSLAELTDGDYSDPYDFVDACSRSVSSGGESAERCRLAQWIEWQALMAHCLG